MPALRRVWVADAASVYVVADRERVDQSVVPRRRTPLRARWVAPELDEYAPGIRAAAGAPSQADSGKRADGLPHREAQRRSLL